MLQIKKLFFLFLPTVFLFYASCAQPLNQKENFTKQDTLRGSIGPGRDWWDVQHYNIIVSPDYNNKTIQGVVTIKFKWLKPSPTNGYMQIDLQEPMELNAAEYGGKKLLFNKTGNTYMIKWPEKDHPNSDMITLYYQGKPREAKNPPWDGGWIWAKDAKGRPWMTVACQGLGASVWYPCKDHQSDEPDLGARMVISIPDTLIGVGNGKLTDKQETKNLVQWSWEVKSPINNYNIIPYIGHYTHLSDTFVSESGKKLSLDYWVLDYNADKAKKQFDRDVKRMLEAFEYWFGPYPFYEDGFKIVESPHLGMEHQSNIAYGNRYMNGYLGNDLSGTGWGLKWDYIIIHESGHEWFANNITTNDIADMWVHEGFTMYSEPLFIEYHYGKKAADEYVQGIRRNISNDKPLIGPYGINKRGSGDMYNKGANLLHTIRQVINNDTLFRDILRGLNKDFYHKTIDSKDVEDYFSRKSGINLAKIFDQYLRSTKIPVLEYKFENDKISYRWTNCVPGFEMPVRLADSDEWLNVTSNWKNSAAAADFRSKGLLVDKNFYITVKKTE